VKLIIAAAAASALLFGPVGTTATAAAPSPPSVTVSPAKHLADGQVVNVTGSGITPSASVQVIQCDIYDPNDSEDNCSPLTTTTAGSGGKVAVNVTLGDPVYRSQDFGDAIPIYCRADHCHMFLVWTGSDGTPQVASSAALQFSGAPARIHVRPSTNLTSPQTVRVNGSAYGARGHNVQILEEACFSIVQGSGCYGALPPVTSYVSNMSTFAVNYSARRFLSDGTDCNDPNMLGQCEITVVVYSHGKPDDSFGVSALGQPAAFLTFEPAAAS
jgi:hypothetical protein